MRIPPGAFSNDSTAPKSSRTTTPASLKAAAIAADTSWSSVRRMRGPASNRWTRAAEGVEDRRDLRAGRAGADDQHRRWNRGQSPGVAVCGRQLGPGHGQRSADTPGTDDDLVGVQAQAPIGHDGVRVGETCRSRPFVHGDAQLVYLGAQGRARCCTSLHTRRTRASSCG